MWRSWARSSPTFPSRGVGKIFLINDIEWDTAMLFARPETGAKSIKDIKGQKVTTVKGTTAHVFLHNAMKANGLDSNKDIELVSMDMAGAVSAFIANATPFCLHLGPVPGPDPGQSAGGGDAVLWPRSSTRRPRSSAGGWPPTASTSSARTC